MPRLNRTTLISCAIATLVVGTAAGTVVASSDAADARAALSRAESDITELRAEVATQRRARSIAVARTRVRTPAAGTVDHALVVAAATYRVPVDRLRRVATCESTLNPAATNGRYVGLFQFGETLWNATPYGSFERSDPYAAALAAAWAFSRGMSAHWPECGRR